MKRLIPLVLLLSCVGCLSVGRIPFPYAATYDSEGRCTSRGWTSLRLHYRQQNPDWRGWETVFPTVQARAYITYKMYFKEEDCSFLTYEELEERKMGKWLGWIPLTGLWLTTPVDAAFDLVCLPWDVMEE